MDDPVEKKVTEAKVTEAKATEAKAMKYHALIVGIDTYASDEIKNLKGCVNDARAFQKLFSSEKLGVDAAHIHIKMLLNEDATRKNIMDGFDHLIKDPNINNGDAIVFFYAGHGSRPEEDTAKGFVEMLCPHDERQIDRGGEYIYGIPDYTFYMLFNLLAQAKGTNITAVFDSCHSGGITRGDDTHVPDNVRFAPGCKKLVGILDRNLLSSRGEMDRETLPGFFHKHLESHVLLAACAETEFAAERTLDGVVRGNFSESLGRQLERVPYHSTSYRDLIHLTGNWPGQHPQAEGLRRDRCLFRFSYSSSLQEFPVSAMEDGELKIELGSIGGAVQGTEFVVRDTMRDKLIGVFKAEKVTFYSCVLVEMDDQGIKSGEKGSCPNVKAPQVDLWKARVLKWNHEKLKIWLDSTCGTAVEDALFPRKPIDNAEVAAPDLRTNPESFCRAGADNGADIKLAIKNDGKSFSLQVQTLKGTVADHKLLPAQVDLDGDRLPLLREIIARIAHFHHFLNKRPKEASDIDVAFQMHKLTSNSTFAADGRRHTTRTPSENIFKLEETETTLSATVKQKDRLGFTLINHSQYDLFPCLFYFDPVTFSIYECYQPPNKSVSPLASNVSHPPKVCIGYESNELPFQISGVPGIGFLKVFLSTRYLELGWIAQDKPMQKPTRRVGTSMRRMILDDTWDERHAIVTLEKD